MPAPSQARCRAPFEAVPVMTVVRGTALSSWTPSASWTAGIATSKLHIFVIDSATRAAVAFIPLVFGFA